MLTTNKLGTNAYQVDADGNVKIVKLNDRDVNIPIKLWNSNWKIPSSSGSNTYEIAAIAKNQIDDGSIFYAIAVKQTTTQNYGAQLSQTNTQWQFLTAKLNDAEHPTSLDIEGNKAVWNVMFPSQYEALVGIDMNGDGKVGVVKTFDNVTPGSIKINRDTDGGIYLVDGVQEIILRTNNINYEQTWVNTMPNPFEMPNGFIQTANKNIRKIAGIEKGDIVQKSALNLFTTVLGGSTSSVDKAAVVAALEKALALGQQVANVVSLDKTDAYDKAWMDAFKGKLIDHLTTNNIAASFDAAMLKTVWDDNLPSALDTGLPDTYWILKQELNIMVGTPKGKTAPEDLVTWQSWTLDRATATNGEVQPTEVKRDIKAGLLEALFNYDLNKDSSIGLTPVPDIAVTNGAVSFARDAELGAYLVLDSGKQFTEIKPDNGMLNLEMNNAMSPPGRRVVAMVSLDDQNIAEYKQLQTSFQGAVEEPNKKYFVLAATEKTPEGTTNCQINLVTYDTALKTATLIQNLSQWTKSAADWEGFFAKDLNADGNIGRGDLTAIAGDIGTERMYKDSDGALYIVDGAVVGDVFTRVVGQEKKMQDPAGNQPMLQFDSPMASSKVVAVKKAKPVDFKTASGDTNPSPAQIIADDVNGYIVLVQRKWKNPSDSVEKIQWEALITNGDGRFNYNPIQINSVGKLENFFDQDLNGDTYIGLNASAAVKQTGDLGTVFVARTDGRPYIVDKTDAEPKIYDIRIKDGGMMELEFSNSWGQGSNKRELVAAERDTTELTKFYLAIKNTNTWTEYPPVTGNTTSSPGGTIKTQVMWEVFTLTLEGQSLIMDWSNVSRGNSILGDEPKLKQDLNDDDKIGPDLENLTLLTTDTTGSRLMRAPDGTLFIKDPDGSPFIVSNAQGLENSNSWTSPGGSGSFKSEAIAVEKLEETSPARTIYKIAIKSTNTNKNTVFNGITSTTEEKTDVNWNILTLNAAGKVLWGNPQSQTDMPIWTKSVASYETQFMQDLNGDGVIGLDASKLIAIPSDKGDAVLKKDAEKTFYIVDDAVTQSIPNSSWFEFDNNWGNGSNKRELVAVEKFIDNYLLAFKTTNIFNGQSDINWEVQTLTKDRFEVDWSKTVWTKNIAGYEVKFNQDLNGDGAIGLDVSKLKLKPLESDLGSSYLAKDDKPSQAEQAYYIVKKSAYPSVEADTVVPLESTAGFEYSNSWIDGMGVSYSNKREAVAVEYIDVSGTTTPTPHLLFKTTSSKAGVQTELRWDIVPLDASTLKPDWSKSTSTKSIVIWEGTGKFNQDLNGDGNATGVPSGLIPLVLDKDGAQLARDSDKGLYILDGGNTIPVQLPGAFEFSNTWENGTDQGSNSQEAIAVQKKGSNFIIALKNSNTFNTETQVNWQIITLDSNGSMIQPSFGAQPIVWAKSISPYEGVDYFNDDLNGDDAKGIDVSKLTKVSSDTHGIGLARDLEKSIYLIADGQSPLPILDAGGLEYRNSWNGGSHERVVVAAQKIENESTYYKLLIKNTNTYTNNSTTNTDVNWEVVQVGTDGKLDWSKGSARVRDVQSLEFDFNEDLNGDDITGIDPAKLTAYATNSDGNLLKSATGEVYIRKGSSYIAVKDEFGTQPVWDTNSQWTNGGYATTPYALVLAGSDYRLAIKLSETLNGTTKTSWQIQTINSNGIVDWSQTLITRSVITAEEIMNLDLDGDKTVGISKALLESKLTKISTDTLKDTLLKDNNNSLYIKMAVAGAAAGDDLLKVTDAVGGSPSLEIISTWNNGESSRTNSAYGVAETAEQGVYKVISKVVTVDAGESKTAWEIFHLVKNENSTNAVIDFSKTIWTDNVLTVEKLLGQDINGDADFSGLPKSLITLELDKFGTSGKYDQLTGTVYINGNLLVTSAAGQPEKLTFTDGSLRSETVAISEIDSFLNTYDIAVSKTFSSTLSIQTGWEILTVNADDGKIIQRIDTASIAGYENQFGQDLNNDGIMGLEGSIKLPVITQDPDVWKDAWGGIYLVKRADGSSVQLKDNLGNAPNFDYNERLPTGDTIKSELFAVEEQLDNTFLIAIRNASTSSTAEQINWMILAANADGIMDWSTSIITEDISTYEFAFNFNLDGKDNIVIVGSVI